MAMSQQSEGGAVDMTVHDDRALLALQGPAAVETLQPLVDLDLSKVYFSDFHKLDIAGIPCYLTRTGCATLTMPHLPQIPLSKQGSQSMQQHNPSQARRPELAVSQATPM